jgi:hypothetical protein
MGRDPLLLRESSTGYGGFSPPLVESDKPLKENEKRALRYVEFEVFLKTWSSYLRIQEDLERLRSMAQDPEDQARLLEISTELLDISKRIFRRMKAVRTPW